MREHAMNTRHERVLADLPVFAPDPALWQRIVAAHEGPRATRHRFRWAAIAAAAAIIAAAVLVLPRSGGAPGTLEAERESQALERQWHALSPAAPRPVSDLARLHVIDATLQAAYDRGARADELKPLWKERNDALRGLILIAQADTITRI